MHKTKLPQMSPGAVLMNMSPSPNDQEQFHLHKDALQRWSVAANGQYFSPCSDNGQYQFPGNDSGQYQSPGNGSHPFTPFVTVPRTSMGARPTRDGEAAGYDRLPLGRLADPLPWDDVSEMRDDCPTVEAVAPAGPVDALPKIRTPTLDRPELRRSTLGRKKTKQYGKTKSNPKESTKIAGKANKKATAAQTTPLLTLVKYNQVLLPPDSTTHVTPPEITIHNTNAILTSDKSVHFYTFLQKQWVQTTTVSLQNTHGLSMALGDNTAVIGVPYDRNARGMLTGSAYIFERDTKTHTWYQVKKIVPKKVQEYATVGHSVDLCGDVVAVGVPELGLHSSATYVAGGAACGRGGSVYIYKRENHFKWTPMEHLMMSADTVYNPASKSPAGGAFVHTLQKFGTIVSLRSNILVISNYHPDDRFSGEGTSLFVYECDPMLKNKWQLIQLNLLSTEEQRRHFGSHLALTVDGEGIFVGCHSDVNPTEILYYRRKNVADVYGNRSYQLQQIITVAERCSIADFVVDVDDNFMLGTLNSNRVYVYRHVHRPDMMEDQGWRIMVQVANIPEMESFGSSVGLSGDNVLVGSRSNVYSYSLEGWIMAKKGKRQHLKKSSGFSMIRSEMRPRLPRSGGRITSPLKFHLEKSSCLIR